MHSFENPTSILPAGAVTPSELVQPLDAGSASVWASDLDTARSLTELGHQLKDGLSALGLEWNALTRLQSLVGGIARWLQAVGGAGMRITSSSEVVACVLTTRSVEVTADLVYQSPLVQMLRAHLSRFEVRQRDGTLEISFDVQRD
jgi:hypothetical protein